MALKEINNTSNMSEEGDYYGECTKCQEKVIGEGNGCSAMGEVYHVNCFTCVVCEQPLRGQQFYAIHDKPYCEQDYKQTLEKCSVCNKAIMDRILRATGKPFHPDCFRCVVCEKVLDNIPFTVAPDGDIHCIEDYHQKFAPRCCVCEEPIVPEEGKQETVRVVALSRSFHVECYKCEDCKKRLSSDTDGHGCYPLNDHIYCKECNADRIKSRSEN